MFWQPTRGILQPNQHWRRGQGGASPTVVFNVAMASTNAGWGGYTLVTRLSALDLTAGTGTTMRVTTEMSAWTSGGTMKGYVGQRNVAGDAYDFAGTPAQLRWGGSTTLTSTGSNLINVSDFVTLPEAYDETKDYCFAFFFSSVATVTLSVTGAGSIDGDFYSKLGDDAATQDKSGYVQESDSRSAIVSIVEVL